MDDTGNIKSKRGIFRSITSTLEPFFRCGSSSRGVRSQRKGPAQKSRSKFSSWLSASDETTVYTSSRMGLSDDQSGARFSRASSPSPNVVLTKEQMREACNAMSRRAVTRRLDGQHVLMGKKLVSSDDDIKHRTVNSSTEAECKFPWIVASESSARNNTNIRRNSF